MSEERLFSGFILLIGLGFLNNKFVLSTAFYKGQVWALYLKTAGNECKMCCFRTCYDIIY